jgi:hypothetical protein
MPDRPREILGDHPPIPDPRTGGGCLVFFGLPLLVPGVAILLIPTSEAPLPIQHDAGGPAWAPTALGAVLALAGLAVVWSGVRGMFRAAAARGRKAEHPLEPWQWDYPWDSRYAESERTGLFRYFKYGKSRLRFARFPFRTGQAVDAGLEVGPRMADATSLRLTLRCIEEVLRSRGGGQDRSTTRTLYLLHEVKQELKPGQFDATSGAAIHIHIPLPAGDYASCLSRSPRRYWELEVKAETPGIDYAARFLLPVYSP